MVRRLLTASSVMLFFIGIGGCSSVIGTMAGNALSNSILNEDDPALVRDGVPSYLLLVDGLVHEHPDNQNLLAAAAQLFALYGSSFADGSDRAMVLTGKAHRYGTQAMCLEFAWACDWDGADYDGFVQHLKEVKRKQVGLLYSYAIGWLAHLQATSQDWSAVAELPWVQASLERVVELDDTIQQGAAHKYLGILYSLRPPALGGHPDKAKAEFERAIELSGGRDLSAKVAYAKRYARMMFDRPLHDRLLKEVLAAPAEAEDLTLFNVLAKQEAQQLLDSADDYF